MPDGGLETLREPLAAVAEALRIALRTQSKQLQLDDTNEVT